MRIFFLSRCRDLKPDSRFDFLFRLFWGLRQVGDVILELLMLFWFESLDMIINEEGHIKLTVRILCFFLFVVFGMDGWE